MPKTTEKIELDFDEMDLITAGLDQLVLGADKVQNAALKSEMQETATSAAKYKNRLLDLKTKFLHV